MYSSPSGDATRDESLLDVSGTFAGPSRASGDGSSATISAPALNSKQRHGVSEVVGGDGSNERGTETRLSAGSMRREGRFGDKLVPEEIALLNE